MSTSVLCLAWRRENSRMSLHLTEADSTPFHTVRASLRVPVSSFPRSLHSPSCLWASNVATRAEAACVRAAWWCRGPGVGAGSNGFGLRAGCAHAACPSGGGRAHMGMRAWGRCPHAARRGRDLGPEEKTVGYIKTSNYVCTLQRGEKKLCISRLSKHDQNLHDSWFMDHLDYFQ
jgi:hypothetical protein